MKRYITLPNSHRVTLGSYVNAWRILKRTRPEALIPGFDYTPEPAADILKALSKGVDDRINRHLPYYGKGRKWGSFWEARRLANAVNSRVAVHLYALSPDLRKMALSRFPHRVTE